MARAASKAPKSETLTIRLDPKTRFILEYMSRLRGQTNTTVVERAIVEAASSLVVIDRSHGIPDGWSHFWHVSEGVRALRMAQRADFFPTFEEEKRLSFAKEHWPFFFTGPGGGKAHDLYIDIIWPKIDEFVHLHDEAKANATDFFAAGKAMQELLRKANITPPEWPEEGSILVKGIDTGSFDDEIKF